MNAESKDDDKPRQRPRKARASSAKATEGAKTRRSTKASPSSREDADEEIDETRLSTNIPRRYKLAFADAVMSFASMESVAELLIWKLVKVSEADGRLLTERMMTGSKMQLLELLLTRDMDTGQKRQVSGNIWKSLSALVMLRNKIVHGSWVMYKRQAFLFAWKVKGEIPDRIFPDPITIPTLMGMTKTSDTLRGTFLGVLGVLSPSEPKSRE